MPLGGAEDEHFSCFHSSCQLGLRVDSNCTFWKKNEKLQIHSAAPQFRYMVAYFMVSMLLGGKFQGKMISVHTFKKG